MKPVAIPLVGPKDPNARRFVWFDVRKDVLRAKSSLVISPMVVGGVTLQPPVITEVDEQRVAVGTPTVTFAAPIADPTGIIAVMTEGGINGQRPLIQCRYALANGETGDATLRLAIAHT